MLMDESGCNYINACVFFLTGCPRSSYRCDGQVYTGFCPCSICIESGAVVAQWLKALGY